MQKMEKIYEPRYFNATEEIDVKKYFDEYAEFYLSSKKKVETMEHTDVNTIALMQEIGVPMTANDLRQLEAHCSINKLTLSDEPEGLPIELPDKLAKGSKFEKYYQVNATARSLETVRCKEVMDNKFEIAEYVVKTKNFPPRKTGINVLCGNMPVASNYIHKILVYRPFSIFIGQRNSSENLRFKYEIEALGTNTLLDVADSISCISDKAVMKEVADTHEDLSSYTNAKEKYPSRCFFINDVFYNDLTSDNAVDYSIKITQWAKEKKIGFFKSDNMSIKLNMLRPRFGYPYVYIHQGNCEHIIAFSDSRLIQETDCLNSHKYPRITDSKRECCNLCCICRATNANWMVIGSDKFLQEKAFVCTECCNSYLYLDGEKIGSFRLFPYYDVELLTRHLQEEDVDDLE